MKTASPKRRGIAAFCELPVLLIFFLFLGLTVSFSLQNCNAASMESAYGAGVSPAVNESGEFGEGRSSESSSGESTSGLDSACPLATSERSTDVSEGEGAQTQANLPDAPNGDYTDVTFLALVNETWVKVNADGTLYDESRGEYVKTRLTSCSSAWSSYTSRMVVTGDALEKAYGPLFGFKAENLRSGGQADGKGKLLFANTINASGKSATLWTDQAPLYSGSDEGSVASSWMIPLRVTSQAVEHYQQESLVFYLPENVPGADSYFSTYKSVEDSALKKANTFYSVSVYEHDGDVEPRVSYASPGATVSVEVQKEEGQGEWLAFDDDGKISCTVKEGADGTLTISVEDVRGPLIIRPANTLPNKYSLSYQAATLSKNLQSLGWVLTHQTVTQDGSIGKAAGKTAAFEYGEDAAEYTVLSPDTDVAETKWSGDATDRRYRYTFIGWKVKATGELWLPGQKVAREQMAEAANYGTTVELEAQWNALDEGTNRIQTANFYISRDCEISDNLQDGFKQNPTQNFTKAIHASRVFGAEGLGLSGGKTSLQVTAPTTEADTAYEVNALLRASATTPIVPLEENTGASYEGDGIQLESFPSDEDVLAALRAGSEKIYFEGKEVAKSDITSENFTVRWYVLKYEESDGWHIDGVLVAKQARMVVKKTFEGDAEAINQIKARTGDNQFSISVTHEEGTVGTVMDYELLLVPDSEVDRKNENDRRWGYSAYDAKTDTYTWELAARQERVYAFKENSFAAEDSGSLSWSAEHRYRVDHSGSDTDGWQSYDANSGFTAVGQAYPTDVPASALQTVSFRNTYLRSGVIAVSKTDLSTGNAMSGVAFAVERLNDEGSAEPGVSLYRKKGTDQYVVTSTYESLADKESYEEVAGGKAFTNANGVFYLEVMPERTYRLTEDFTTAMGYEGASYVSFVVGSDGGKLSEVKAEGAPGSSEVEATTWASGEGSAVLSVNNRASRHMSVTAKKEWAGSDAQKQEVVVELWRSYGSTSEKIPNSGTAPVFVDEGTGASDASAVDAGLSEARGSSVAASAASAGTVDGVRLNEENSWTYTWMDLPLFIDNQAVDYFLRETWVGNTAYDASADTDGYADYLVTYAQPLYSASVERPSNEAGYDHETSFWQESEGSSVVFGKHAYLKVSNSVSRGAIAFAKKDREGNGGKPLAGATFELFADAVCTNSLGKVTSGVDGMVNFGEQPAGTYYFKEIKAPDGYTFTGNALYKAVVRGGKVTITLADDASNAPVSEVCNKFGMALEILKVGSTDKDLLKGAEFALYKAADASGSPEGSGSSGEAASYEYFASATSGSDGAAWITGIEQGDYKLVEVHAPPGYEPQTQELFFRVETSEGQTTARVVGDAVLQDAGPYVSFARLDSDAEGGNGLVYQLKVRNKALYSLPTTGGAGILWPTLLGTLLMCAALFWRFGRLERTRVCAAACAGGRRRIAGEARLCGGGVAKRGRSPSGRVSERALHRRCGGFETGELRFRERK